MAGASDLSRRDPLSDSGVLRLLGDHRPTALPDEAQRDSSQQVQQKQCPRCRENLLQSVTVCIYCNLYLGPIEDSLRADYDDYRRRLAMRHREP